MSRSTIEKHNELYDVWMSHEASFDAAYRAASADTELDAIFECIKASRAEYLAAVYA